MKHVPARFLNILAISLLMLTSFLVGYQLRDIRLSPAVWAAMLPAANDNNPGGKTFNPMSLVQQAYYEVTNEYVDPVKNTDEMAYAAIRGMLTPLNDPYTRFMDPTEFGKFREQTAGRFVGIGATLHLTEKEPTKVETDIHTKGLTCPVCHTDLSELENFKKFRVTVLKPLPGSPAERSGLKAGDVILKVDDYITDGELLDNVVDHIRGPEGTKVTLLIERKNVPEPLKITITRAPIEVAATESKILPGNIGYLQISSFNDKTAPETRAELEKFRDANVKGLLLDLRGNPGGLLTECIRVASMLLDNEHQVIVSTKSRDRVQKDELRTNEQYLFKGPIVLLVNKGSASASEILTGALMDYHRATVVGETTFGKALVQTVITLGDFRNPCAMPVTTARYYTPNGTDLNKKGLTPDVVVKLDENTTELNENDNQAKEALRILKEKM